MVEQWKWIKGFEGEYQISNHGNLKSFLKNKNGHLYSLNNAKGDYIRVILQGRKCRRSASIHTLVAEAFIEAIPKGYQVHHRDGNKQNNVVENLEILSPKEHNKKTKEHNPDYYKGMNHYNQFVKPYGIMQLDLNGNLIEIYPNAKFASDATGVCQRNILQVAHQTPYNNKGYVRKQAGGYIWKAIERGWFNAI